MQTFTNAGTWASVSGLRKTTGRAPRQTRFTGVGATNRPKFFLASIVPNSTVFVTGWH